MICTIEALRAGVLGFRGTGCTRRVFFFLGLARPGLLS